MVYMIQTETSTCTFLWLVANMETHKSTRINKNKIIYQRFENSRVKTDLLWKLPKKWNKFPDNVITAPSIKAFTSELDIIRMLKYLAAFYWHEDYFGAYIMSFLEIQYTCIRYKHHLCMQNNFNLYNYSICAKI